MNVQFAHLAKSTQMQCYTVVWALCEFSSPLLIPQTRIPLGVGDLGLFPSIFSSSVEFLELFNPFSLSFARCSSAFFSSSSFRLFISLL